MKEYFLFHHFKHHLQSLRAWVTAHADNVSDETIRTIKSLGSSQLDMYCGNLTVDEIIQQGAAFLQQQGIDNVAQFAEWVGNSYKLFTLTDGSSFTMRYIENIKPAHIHPSRHALGTVRIKANALKTAVLYVIAYGNNPLDIAALNALRVQYLGLSPVAGKHGIEEIEKAMRLLINDLQWKTDR